MSMLTLAPPPPRPIDHSSQRRLTIVLSLVAASVALAVAVSENSRRRDYLALGIDLGVATRSLAGSDPSDASDLERQVGHVANAHRAGLLVARSIVAFELDPRRWQRVSDDTAEAERALSRHRLEVAKKLATAALLSRPADWQAPMLLGATRFLDLLAARDVALYRHPRQWEEPLQLARRRGPVFSESSRLLTAGYLEIWPLLPRAGRAGARGVLAEAFADPPTFDRFFPAWARLARGREELYQPLPDRSQVWLRVAAFHAQKFDWPGWLDTRGRAEHARLAELDASLAEARARAAGGDTVGAQRLFVATAQACSPSLADAERFEAAIRERPAGPVGASLAGTTRDWLTWAVPLCRLGTCPLGGETFARLAATPGLFPEDAATALLLADDLPAAERRERREESQWSEAWASYLVLKARRLATHGDEEGARAALALVHRAWRERLSTLLARAETARRSADLAERSAAEAALVAVRRRSWEATEWLWRGPSALLELLPEITARTLRVELLEVPARGAVVELQWNGRALPPQVVAAGQSSLSVEVNGREEPSLLRLRSLAGGTVRPGRVELAP